MPRGRVGVSKRRVLAHEASEGVSGLDQPLVGKDGVPFVVYGLLPEKFVVGSAPPGIRGRPCSRLLGGSNLEEPLCQRVEIDSGLRARPRGRITLHLLEGVEGAFLHASVRPDLPSGNFQSRNSMVYLRMQSMAPHTFCPPSKLGRTNFESLKIAI